MEANLGVSPSGTTDEVVKSYVDSFLGNRAAAAYVATSEATSSTTYTDLTTTTDTVTATVGASGMALVMISVGSLNFSANPSSGLISFAMSGANVVSASDGESAQAGNTTNGISPNLQILLTGLTAGSTTFKMKYRATAGTVNFINRRIAVIPL